MSNVEAGLIELRQIPDEENDADVLTKIVTGRPFRTKARRLLGLIRFLIRGDNLVVTF